MFGMNARRLKIHYLEQNGLQLFCSEFVIPVFNKSSSVSIY